MTEQVLELVRALADLGQDEEMARTLCGMACRTLNWRMKDGLEPEDCQGVYPVAAAWLVLDWLRGSRGLEGITSVTAGDISVRREAGGSDGGGLSERAWELMRPFLRDDGFVFQGVSG